MLIFRLSDASVSKRHAILVPPEGQSSVWHIRDTESTNGTFINGNSVTQGRITHMGFTEEVRCGRVNALFIDNDNLSGILEYAREAWLVPEISDPELEAQLSSDTRRTRRLTETLDENTPL